MNFFLIKDNSVAWHSWRWICTYKGSGTTEVILIKATQPCSPCLHILQENHLYRAKETKVFKLYSEIYFYLFSDLQKLSTKVRMIANRLVWQNCVVYKLETDSHATKQLVTLRDPTLKAELYFLFFDFTQSGKNLLQRIRKKDHSLVWFIYCKRVSIVFA